MQSQKRTIADVYIYSFSIVLMLKLIMHTMINNIQGNILD